jgi:mycofactocin glycosyltransferase
MRYRVDGSWTRVGPTGDVLLAGSPYRVVRLSADDIETVERVEDGHDVADSALIDELLDGGMIHPVVSVPARYTLADVTVVTPQLGGEVRRDGRVTIDDGSVPALAGATERLDVNAGPAAARNAGRRHVDTELIAFVDADVDLPTDDAWWAPLLAHFDDDRVGLVAPRVLGDDGSSLDLGAEPARVRAGTRVAYVPAAMMLVRASAFDEVGGFDEALRFGEDVDVVWRLDEAGWRCRYEPSVTVSHPPLPTWGARLARQVDYGSSSAPLSLRHTGGVAPLRSNGWTAGVWLLAIAGRLPAALALAAGSSAALIPKLPGVPPKLSVELALRGHLAGGRELALAFRRAWWPLVLAGCLVSRRMRRAAALAMLVSPRTLPVGVAFGTGIWKGMFELRTWRPLAPSLTPWPPRR